jgi:predicted nucleotidyltransferase
VSAWTDRLRRNRASLQSELTGAQVAALGGILAETRAGGELEFLVVYGSVSRGEQRADSDLDVYYETRDEAVELQEADPESASHVFGAAAGSLEESLREGDEMAFEIASDALVVYDDGAFESLIADTMAPVGVEIPRRPA